MTGKRFECYDLIFDGFIKDTLTNENIVEPIKLIHLLNEQDEKIKELQKENEQLKNKLNVTALELVDEAISMGKAVEISEMNYHEFLEYRKKKGKPMELQR